MYTPSEVHTKWRKGMPIVRRPYNTVHTTTSNTIDHGVSMTFGKGPSF